ncbi:hypothetical protein [Streptomyces sp. NPDC048606]|uniref:hypothetical protein n=1 Tax=Streptomyces sp. NPDC048606 TaxID=3154726 RepID=UPI00343CF304
MATVLPNGATLSDAAESALNAARNRTEYEDALRQAPACLYEDPFGSGMTFYEKTADGHLFLRHTAACNLQPERCPEGYLYFNMTEQKNLYPDETPRLGDGSDPNPKTGQIY